MEDDKLDQNWPSFQNLIYIDPTNLNQCVTLYKTKPPLTMHELKEFVDHSFEELPVGSEKAWILANNIHDVGGYDGLVVLSSFLLAQTQQILKQTGQKGFSKSFT